jgi:hypothetical protein
VQSLCAAKALLSEVQSHHRYSFASLLASHSTTAASHALLIHALP